MIRRGMFGTIEVRDSRGLRSLLINNQVQGGSAMNPSAKIVDPKLSGPGPVSASPYTMGWMACALHHPTGHGLMVGLGSGAGVTSLLYQFPGIKLTVVDIDPELIAACRSGFPLVDHYCDRGRLEVVEADIRDYLARDDISHDFVLHDAYDGGKTMAVGGHVFYRRLAELTPSVWINIIGKPHSGHMLDEMVAMSQSGLTPKSLFCADYTLLSPFNEFVDMRRNWIVSSEETIPERLDAFIPYEGIETKDDSPETANTVNAVREFWDAAAATEMDSDEIAELIACCGRNRDG